MSPSNIPAAIAAVVMALFGIYADDQNRVLHEQKLRADVSAKVNVIRAKLEGNVSANLQLVRGLVSTVMTEPYMGQQRFGQLTQSLFREQSQLRNIAGAPDFIVSLIYPLAGNQKVLGLDYRTDPEQAPAALEARDTGKLVLVGPIALKQGGQGFIARFPVFIDPQGPKRRFWGLISAVIDVDRLYADSGIKANPDLDVALLRPNEAGQALPFYGPGTVMAKDPVVAAVYLPSGSWQVAAVPHEGWDTLPSNAFMLRILLLIAGVSVVIPMVIAGRFYDSRQRGSAALRESDRRLSRLSRRHDLALAATQLGVWEQDLVTGEVLWDDRLYELYGLPTRPKARDYADWIAVVHPEDRMQAEADYAQALSTSGRYTSEYRIIRPDGAVRHIRARALLFQEPNETPKLVGADWDVTDDKSRAKALDQARAVAETRAAELATAQKRIEYNALHDDLTGLPNRRYLDQMLASLEPQTSGKVALLQLDLDRFKEINDTLGHAAGDAMLVHAAKILQSALPNEFVARIGGDEFVALCLEQNEDQEISELADRVVRRMRKPVAYDGHQCRFGVSIGIAVEPRSTLDPKKLMMDADMALYRAKSRGRNRYEFFTSALEAEIVRNKRIGDDILRGFERDEFTVVYQPQVDSRTMEIVGAEALVRWQHPTEGLLAPHAFLKAAEDRNLTAAIDKLVLTKALKDFKNWTAAGVAIPRISVNVSARRLRDETLISSLRLLDFQPGTLSFELLESIFLDDSDDELVWDVDRIKDAGIDIEIDDFGTGYASIISLLKLQPKRLKIDRQLIRPVVSSTRQRNLIGSILEMGRTLGIEVIAEGVETLEHVRVLKGLGCHVLQGYALGKPMPAEALAVCAREKRWLQAG